MMYRPDVKSPKPRIKEEFEVLRSEIEMARRIRVYGCFAPLQRDVNEYMVCTLCGEPTKRHPMDKDKFTWYLIPQGEEDEWTDLAVIMSP
jgi:hypothetical protein